MGRLCKVCPLNRLKSRDADPAVLRQEERPFLELDSLVRHARKGWECVLKLGFCAQAEARGWEEMPAQGRDKRSGGSEKC